MSQKNYKQLQSELQEILSAFEQSSHEDVEELIADYERGVKLIKDLEKILNSAELKIKKIKQTL